MSQSTTAALGLSEPLALNVEPHLPLIAELAAQGRANRQVEREAIDAIIESGFMRALLPKPWGGLEATPQAFFRAHLRIAEQDMSTAWVAGIIAVHAFQLAIMNRQALDDVYAEGPNTLISSSYNPVGAKVEPTDGGFKLSGRWGWSSGSEHCTWVFARRHRARRGLPHLPSAAHGLSN